METLATGLMVDGGSDIQGKDFWQLLVEKVDFGCTLYLPHTLGTLLDSESFRIAVALRVGDASLCVTYVQMRQSNGRKGAITDCLVGIALGDTQGTRLSMM